MEHLVGKIYASIRWEFSLLPAPSARQGGRASPGCPRVVRRAHQQGARGAMANLENVRDAKNGSLNMGNPKQSTSPTLVKQRPRASAKSGDGYRLHLVMDRPSYARFTWLVGALRAASLAEVLRRALDAYQLFDPVTAAQPGDGVNPDNAAAPGKSSSADFEHLYIVISDEMKAQLDEEKAAHGRTYKETVSRALCVLTQIVRERAKLVAEKATVVAEQKKGDDESHDRHRIVDTEPHTNAGLDPVLLASV